jgi:glycosyltransferase involved in cell wall biosynthesis
MSKPFLLFRGPVKTRSGYGAHARDILQALYELDLYDIKIDSCLWGGTPLTALDSKNPFHNWIESNIVLAINTTPDIYIEVTVPNEFTPKGRFNIGITAGIETTVAPKEWVDGCNKMDLVITTSEFSKDVLLTTVYNETENRTGRLLKQHKINKNIEVLFEGVNTKIFNNTPNGTFDLSHIKEDFCYLFVGHWLKGDVGQDRKDIGMLLRVFTQKFKDLENAPALILKTSYAGFSVMAREEMRRKIQDVVGQIENPPSVYLLFGELSDEEMNELYNHPKVKGMVSITKGEGFGRPLLEFSMTGKPIIASNWSGHKDFLPIDKAVLIGGTLTEVHDSAVDTFILKGSKWFTANYNEFGEVMSIVYNQYEKFIERSENLRLENSVKFTMEEMKNKLATYLQPIIPQPKMVDIKLPKLEKIK